MRNQNSFLTFKENIRDNINDKCNATKKIRGKVCIKAHRIEGSNKKLFLVYNTSNLVVYRGRNLLAQRAFGTDLTTGSGKKDWYINWFAIGSGGAVAGNPLTASSPDLINVQLGTHGVIDSGIRYATISGKQYHIFDENYPTFNADDEIDTTTLASADDGKLIVNATTTLTRDEANDDGGNHALNPDSYQEINEAGLFMSTTNSISTPPSEVQMFARVTFPTIVKNYEVEISFSWYIFF